MIGPRFPNLRRRTVMKLSRAFKAMGRKLPRVGWCAPLPLSGKKRGEVCHDNRGYFLVGTDAERAIRDEGLDGLKRHTKRRRRR